VTRTLSAQQSSSETLSGTGTTLTAYSGTVTSTPVVSTSGTRDGSATGALGYSQTYLYTAFIPFGMMGMTLTTSLTLGADVQTGNSFHVGSAYSAAGGRTEDYTASGTAGGTHTFTTAWITPVTTNERSSTTHAVTADTQSQCTDQTRADVPAGSTATQLSTWNDSTASQVRTTSDTWTATHTDGSASSWALSQGSLSYTLDNSSTPSTSATSSVETGTNAYQALS